MTPSQIEVAKLIVSALALLGTAAAAVVGIRSYLRNEKWKRAEFLASEMKEYLGDARVQKALLLIDWGSRSFQLLHESAPEQGRIRVTRQLQVRALLPHTIVDSSADLTADQPPEETEGRMRRFSPEEAAIRDCYDAFLDGLERLSSYVQSGLVSGAELRPYIGYWIDDIHAATKDPDDAAWAAALLTYIEFYRFKGVQWLFGALGRDIACGGSAYRSFLRDMRDQALATRLAYAVNVSHDPSSDRLPRTTPRN